MAVDKRTILNVPPLHQKGTVLCWAAAINMVLNYLENGNQYRQGELSDKLRQFWSKTIPNIALSPAEINECNTFVIPSDPGDFSTAMFGKQWNFGLPTSKLANQQFDTVISGFGYYSIEDQDIVPLTWKMVEKLIKTFQRPFILILHNAADEGMETINHAVVVRGIWTDTDGNKYLYVNDPFDIGNLPNPVPYSLHFDNLINNRTAMRIQGFVINVLSKNKIVLKYSRVGQTITIGTQHLPDNILEGGITDMYMGQAVP